MEYSIGFFGGLGLAYGVYSSKWPIEDAKGKNWTNMVSLFILVVFIPLIIYRESLTYDHLIKRLGDVASVQSVALISTLCVVGILILVASVLFWKLSNGRYLKKDIAFFLFVYLSTYAVLSYIVTGIFAGEMSLNHHLYVLNIAFVFMLFQTGKWSEFSMDSETINIKKWTAFFLMIIVFIAILSLIAINFHDGLPGQHNRFLMN